MLQININEVDEDGGAYANMYLLFAVDPADYTGKKVLTVPRCCQKRKGTQDRGRINSSVIDKEKWRQEMAERSAKMALAKSTGAVAPLSG